MSRVQCVRPGRLADQQHVAAYGKRSGWQRGGRGCRGGDLSLHSVLCSAGESGYVTVIIMRGSPGLAVCQPLTFSALSHNSSEVAK